MSILYVRCGLQYQPSVAVQLAILKESVITFHLLLDSVTAFFNLFRGLVC